MLCREGSFAELHKTELVDGVVYSLSPRYRPHGFVKDELAYRLRRALEDLRSTLHVATEQSLAIAPSSEPQPDVLLTSEPIGPGAIPVGSVALIVEVSDATVSFDRKQKAAVYAAAGIAEYWVADVNGRTVRQLWNPVDGAYADRRDVSFGERLAVVSIAGLSIEISAL